MVAGRVAVVTGSNKGIGYAIAGQLAASGLFQHIVLACRDVSLAHQAAASLLQQQLGQGGGGGGDVSFYAEALTVGNSQSHANFATRLSELFDSKLDCLVNNAGMAFKNADPTPFAEQCQPTLDVNFRGTVDLTETLWPLLERGTDARVVNVASMAGRLSQVSSSLQAKFSDESLAMAGLHQLVNSFQNLVLTGDHIAAGYSNSNYGMSKLALVAATRIWARDHPSIAVNCCCPGYCKTDMTSQKGMRDPSDGARNAVIPVTMVDPPTGAYFADYKVSQW